MTPKQFQRYLDRDQICYHCGATEGLVPHHRANRGMGGSKARHIPSNIIVVCSQINGLMESDAVIAEQAYEYGWKLYSWEDPREVAVYNAFTGFWVKLDDNFGIWLVSS